MYTQTIPDVWSCKSLYFKKRICQYLDNERCIFADWFYFPPILVLYIFLFFLFFYVCIFCFLCSYLANCLHLYTRITYVENLCFSRFNLWIVNIWVVRTNSAGCRSMGLPTQVNLAKMGLKTTYRNEFSANKTCRILVRYAYTLTSSKLWHCWSIDTRYLYDWLLSRLNHAEDILL